ncbi:hypothetical protein [Nocardioides marmoribigeumensis]|uniref:Uncharacterized protein n=1 Tax=Nocardioides marmoribigeumensis TaxID=433649 RepID=A0ABU2C091_9ACTN|nr:hypothetical protein [Nocardioides marmoribigeumensis]MDR7364062.1 hypothetical protein [Nocardioides marmoribigeumensis]
MSGFCGDRACANRVQFFLMTPDDEGIAEPCAACLAALAATLEVGGPAASLRDLHRAVLARGAA